MKRVRNEILWMLGILVLLSWCIGFVHSNGAQTAKINSAGKNSAIALIQPEKFLDYIQPFLQSRSVDRIVDLLISLPAREALKRARIIIEEQGHDLLREDELQLVAALADHYKKDQEAQGKFFELLLFDPVYYQNKSDEEPFGYVIAYHGYAGLLPKLWEWASRFYVSGTSGKRPARELMGDFIQNALRRIVEKDEDELLRAMPVAHDLFSKQQATALLTYAAQLPRSAGKVIAWLKKQGADVNAIDNLGNTPLLYAVKNNNRALVQALLKEGADVNLMPSSEKGTALQLARSLQHTELESLLRTHGAKD
ncbi:ankyrin repeat domain-containing protein [Candidatus Dependentiae bacterium]|nr:ankyrin repeat domain-containing protein [Candidatus Dependentiae bacterium]